MLAPGLEDATRIHRVGLAEELNQHRRAIDVTRPAEARLALMEVRLFQIVLKRAVGLRSLVA